MSESENTPKSLIGMSSREMEQFVVRLGEPPFRGRQLYKWIYHHRVTDFDCMSDLSLSFRKQLTQKAIVPSYHPSDEFIDEDESRKYLFQFSDSERIEAVYIPENTRKTLCLSTQIGCPVGCGFCATGKIGFIRNLICGEIIGQFLAIERIVENKITNVVMMGMGEPLLNRRHLFNALRLMTDNDGIGFPQRKITVSTSGWIPGIEAMNKAGLKVKLAVSLNGTTELQRRKLMPLAARWSIPEIMEVTERYSRSSKTKVSLGYVLLNGENDSDQDAHRLAKIANQLGAKVNLMEYNEIHSDFMRSDPERRDRFYNILKDSNLTITLRTSRGTGVTGACGQLAGGYKIPVCQ